METLHPVRCLHPWFAPCLALLGIAVACASDPETTPGSGTSLGATTSAGAGGGSAESAATTATPSSTGGVDATSFSSASSTTTSDATTTSATTTSGGETATTSTGAVTSAGDVTGTSTGVAGSSSVGTTATGTSGGTTTGAGGTTSSTTSATSTTGGGTVIYVPSDYISRKWARWPIPNPPTLSLPHPMSYSANSDGVLDQVTGLTWQAGTNSGTTTWQDALSYCVGLGAGWSLPTRIELTSILDNTVSGMKVDKSVFSGSSGWTWASTPWVVNERKGLTGSAALSWFINFSVGDSNNSLSQTAASAYSRCVKLPASRELPAEHYSVGTDVVTDNYTGLTWQRAHSAATPTLSFDQALSYCQGLALDGGGWRLPSLNELASVVDDVPSGDVSPAVDHDVFPDTATDALYWSASSYGTSTSEHWTLNFLDGFTAHNANSTAGIARCVR